jgi:hypothetical protein
MKRRIPVMTIKQRFEVVKNKELREKLLKNYDVAYSTRFSCKANCTCDRDALQYGFVWEDSNEGHVYWRAISLAMTDKSTLDDAYAKVYGSVPDMPSIPPPPKPAKKYKYNIIRDAIEVTQSIGEHEWRAIFDIDSFVVWVKENV